MANPSAVTDTIIHVKPASKIHDDDWIASAIIVWPDGSCDIGASGLRGKTTQEVAADGKTLLTCGDDHKLAVIRKCLGPNGCSVLHGINRDINRDCEDSVAEVGGSCSPMSTRARPSSNARQGGGSRQVP